MSSAAERWEYLLNIQAQNPRDYQRIKHMLTHSRGRDTSYIALRDRLGILQWEVTMLDAQGAEVILIHFHTYKEAAQFCQTFHLFIWGVPQ